MFFFFFLSSLYLSLSSGCVVLTGTRQEAAQENSARHGGLHLSTVSKRNIEGACFVHGRWHSPSSTTAVAGFRCSLARDSTDAELSRKVGHRTGFRQMRGNRTRKYRSRFGIQEYVIVRETMSGNIEWKSPLNVLHAQSTTQACKRILSVFFFLPKFSLEFTRGMFASLLISC